MKIDTFPVYTGDTRVVRCGVYASFGEVNSLVYTLTDA